MIGERLQDDFEILELIRTTASGTIYRARQLSLNREVAVTVLDSREVNQDALQAFLAQARKLASLDHPNVVRVYQIGDHLGVPFIVTEAMTGQLLAELPAAELTTKQKLRIMTDVARGLHAIHHLGIVHRNLSPRSIVVNVTAARIFDLGQAKPIRQITYESQENQEAQAADYLSPEQISSGAITITTDVFAFGVVLYELLAGVRPFQAGHQMAVLLKIVHDPPEPLPTAADPLLEHLSNLVMRCLEKDPARRPQSLAVVEAELARVEASAALPSLPAASTSERPGKSGGLNPYANTVMIRTREDFFGRKQEVRWIYARLNANNPQSISIVGDRKIGKSSLLNYIYMQANRTAHLRDPDKTIMIFMNLQGQKDVTIESFARTLLRMAALELGERLSISDCRHDLDGIREMVERLHTAGYRLVILLDEFERITSNPNFPLEFFSFLRFLVTLHDVAYITSSVRDLQALCHDRSIKDSPFFNVFSTRRLTALLPEEAREMIRVPSRRIGSPLEAHTEQILALSGLFPFFLQLACFYTVDSLEERGEPDFKTIRQLFAQELRLHFQDLWEEFEAGEQLVLRRVAREKRIPEAYRYVLEELTTRQYVEMHGTSPRLFSPVFAEFVLRAPRPRERTHKPKLYLAGALGLALVLLLFFRPQWISEAKTFFSRGLSRNRTSRPITEIVPQYGNSYALVIGARNYASWDKLDGTKEDVRQVKEVLEEYGFHVVSVEDPTAEGLEAAFKDFTLQYGRHKDDRLLIYFAGHGYTEERENGEPMGYIVPIDAPNPQQDEDGFLARAMDMEDVRGYARKIRAKHVLFVFDACFAGTIFNTFRSAAPPNIQVSIREPVRQFITSGNAKERVPDQSCFRRWFIQGLRGGADLIPDGYVTGHELGLYLQQKVRDESGGEQNPQYGFIRGMGEGDVVFSLKDLASEHRPGAR